VQPVASGGDPCVDVGLVRDMKCAFSVVEVARGVVCAVLVGGPRLLCRW
jgi:hypothetical protein